MESDGLLELVQEAIAQGKPKGLTAIESITFAVVTDGEIYWPKNLERKVALFREAREREDREAEARIEAEHAALKRELEELRRRKERA